MPQQSNAPTAPKPMLPKGTIPQKELGSMFQKASPLKFELPDVLKDIARMTGQKGGRKSRRNRRKTTANKRKSRRTRR